MSTRSCRGVAAGWLLLVVLVMLFDDVVVYLKEVAVIVEEGTLVDAYEHRDNGK